MIIFQLYFKRHYFHRTEIETWLFQNQTCPICKIDILKAFGLNVQYKFVIIIKRNIFLLKFRKKAYERHDKKSRNYSC